MRTRSRLVAGVLAGGLLLAACGDEDVSEEGLVRSLLSGEEPAVSEEQARCIADTLYAQFGEEEISRIADAASPAELPPGAEQAIGEAYDSCVDPSAG